MPTLPADTDVVLVFSTNCVCEKGLWVVANLPSASVPVTQIKVGSVEDEDDDDEEEEDEEVESAARTALKRAKNQIKKTFMMSRM